jgi:hypothetical protein
MSRLWSVTVVSVVVAIVAGCGSKKPDPIATEITPTDPPGSAATKQAEPAKDPAAPTVAAAADSDATGDAALAPAPDAAVGGAPIGDGDGGANGPSDATNPGAGDPAAAADAGAETTPGTFVQAGSIVRTPDPETPEGVIQRAIVAAMEPDEAKAWEQFLALLHTDEKLPNALYSRRSRNFAAMRRKLKLFLIEDGTKPYYQVDRVIEGPDAVRLFVHNKSSMPTPCEVRRDKAQENKWRVATCSL